MPTRRIASFLAVLAVLCVLAVFFFHAIEGPYSAVHGPVTALLSARAAAGLRMAIIFAGIGILPVWLGVAASSVSWLRIFLGETLFCLSSFDCNCTLRC